MDNDELWGAPRVYVHLIHGTWANGIVPERLRKLLPWKPKPAPPAWFENEGRFHDNLMSDLMREPVVIDGSFRWSGYNSFGARQEAAEALRAKLEKVHEDWPDTPQVIVAHSHGGTIAALALSQIADYTRLAWSVHTLVCLSTPFIYLQPHRGHGRIKAAVALGFVLAAIVNIALALGGVYQRLAGWWAFGTIISVFLFSGAIVILANVWEREHYDNWAPLPHNVRVSLMRTTRDEASLIIGLAQATHWIGGALYTPENYLLNSLPMLLFAPAYLLVHWAVSFAALPDVAQRLNLSKLPVFAASPMLFLLHRLAAFASLSTIALEPLLLLLLLSILPAIYVAGLCMLMLATGMRDPREWGKQVVEVEAAPMAHACEVTIFRDYDGLPAGLRHSQIYAYRTVRTAVADLISDIIRSQREAEYAQENAAKQKNGEEARMVEEASPEAVPANGDQGQ